jgi:hypothetical protein
MTLYAYPASAMYGDYLCAAAGFVPPTTILATAQVGPVAAVVLSGFAALFAVFGLRTILRHGTRFEMTESGLQASGLHRALISWGQLDRMALAYYSTRRDRRDGWMQLDLRAGGTRVRLDSRMDGFAEVAEKSARVARARGLSLNAATFANLTALGLGFSTDSAVREAAGGPM